MSPARKLSYAVGSCVIDLFHVLHNVACRDAYKGKQQYGQINEDDLDAYNPGQINCLLRWGDEISVILQEFFRVLSFIAQDTTPIFKHSFAPNHTIHCFFHYQPTFLQLRLSVALVCLCA